MKNPEILGQYVEIREHHPLDMASHAPLRHPHDHRGAMATVVPGHVVTTRPAPPSYSHTGALNPEEHEIMAAIGLLTSRGFTVTKHGAE